MDLIEILEGQPIKFVVAPYDETGTIIEADTPPSGLTVWIGGVSVAGVETIEDFVAGVGYEVSWVPTVAFNLNDVVAVELDLVIDTITETYRAYGVVKPTGNNLITINGLPISEGIIRLNVITTPLLKNGVLTLMRKDTYSVANGNPITFESADLPDLTIPTGATLTILTLNRDLVLTKTTTLLDNALKKIKFELTEAEMTTDKTTTNLYDVVLNYAVGKRTVFSGKNVILDDLS